MDNQLLSEARYLHDAYTQAKHQTAGARLRMNMAREVYQLYVSQEASEAHAQLSDYRHLTDPAYAADPSSPAFHNRAPDLSSGDRLMEWLRGTIFTRSVDQWGEFKQAELEYRDSKAGEERLLNMYEEAFRRLGRDGQEVFLMGTDNVVVPPGGLEEEEEGGQVAAEGMEYVQTQMDEMCLDDEEVL